MTNNKVTLIEIGEDDVRIVYARNRLLRLYNSLRKNGGWRAVAEKRGSKNQQYVYNFAMKGIEPPLSNPRERVACFLPKGKLKPFGQKQITPAWLRKIRKEIAGMARDTRIALGLQK